MEVPAGAARQGGGGAEESEDVSIHIPTRISTMSAGGGRARTKSRRGWLPERRTHHPFGEAARVRTNGLDVAICAL